jgi:hypothetical protein
MALLFCDSFDHYDTAHILEKYTAAPGCQIITGGRNPASSPNNCLEIPAEDGFYYLNRPVAASTTLIVGVALNPGSLSGTFNGQFLAFLDNANVQLFVQINISGQVLVTELNGTILASTASGLIAANVYNYIEVQVLFATTATGSIAIQVNGVAAANVGSIQTAFDGNASANIVSLGQYGMQTGSAPTFLFDDFYICDGTTTVNNTFLGDVKVALAMPNGVGRLSQWTRTGGTTAGNYTAVDEIPPDDDTSYVSSSTVGQVDSYLIGSIGTPAAIVAVQLVASARKDDSGSRVVALGFGNSTTTNFNAGTSVPNEYTMITRPMNTNPITSASWAPTDLTSAQIGLDVIS